MRVVKFKSSISVLSLIVAIGYSGVAFAVDGFSGGEINSTYSYIYAGEDHASADASNANVSAVNVADDTSIAIVYGGITDSGNANYNTLTITNSTLTGGTAGDTGYAFGGRTNSGNAIGNTVSLTASHVGVVYGGSARQGNANNNAIVIVDSTVDHSVKGAAIVGSTDPANPKTAQNNSVVISGNSLISQGVWGADIYSSDGTAVNNKVTIKGGIISGVWGGRTVNGNSTGNIVEISGTTQIESYVSGGVSQSDDGPSTGSVINNSVIISGGTLGSRVFGGRSENGAVTGNSVTISAGTIAGVVNGGYSLYAGNVSKNTIVMTGGTASSQLVGGWATTGTTTNNSVSISGNSSAVDVMGGLSEKGASADANSVVISDNAQISGVAAGGYSPEGNATNNSVTINGGTIGLQAYAGRSTSGNVSGNKVTMSSGTVTGSVFGGRVDGAGTATDNSVTITSGTLGNDVTGAWSQTGEVSGNTVSISNATVARNVGGGYVENGGGNALNNSVTLSNSVHVNGVVFGGFTKSGSANQNTVTLENTTIDNADISGNINVDGAVYGGFTEKGDATGNTITLNGENITLGGAIYGGYDTAGTGNIFTGNTLNLNAYRGSVSGIYNVENYNWLLPKNVAANQDALIHITGADAVELDNTKHTVALYNDGLVLNAGDKIYLIDKATGTPVLTKTSVQQGQFLVYDMTMAVEGDDLVLTVGTKDDKTPTDTGGSNASTSTGGSNGSTSTGTGEPNGSSSTDRSTGSVLPNMPFIPNVPSQRGVNINPRTKAFSEGRVASLGFTAQGSDLIATSIVNIREQVVQSDKIGFVPFLLTEGSSQTYKTGSSVDVKGFNMAAGLAARHEFEAGHQLTVGAFFEYGQGTYDTFNSFTNYASVRGDGNTHYTGGGVLGRIDIAGTGMGNVATLAPSQADGIYIEASLRAGRVKNKYDASNLVDPEGYGGQYDSSVTYFGAHGAVGYVFNFDEKQSLDAYGRYLYTHMGSDTVTIGKDRLNFDSSTSSRIQIGGRYSYQYNEQVKPFVGAAYEYEAKGDVSATAYNMKLAKPSLEGSTGIFEAGVSFKPLEAYKNIGVDVKGRGFAGERKGGGGNIKLTAEF